MKVGNILKLSELLARYHVPVEKWGQGQAKTFGHFYKELENGESSLTLRNGKLIRMVAIVIVDVIYKGKDKLLWTKQVVTKRVRARLQKCYIPVS